MNPEKVFLCGLRPTSVRVGVLGGESGLALIMDCLLNYLTQFELTSVGKRKLQ